LCGSRRVRLVLIRRVETESFCEPENVRHRPSESTRELLWVGDVATAKNSTDSFFREAGIGIDFAQQAQDGPGTKHSNLPWVGATAVVTFTWE